MPLPPPRDYFHISPLADSRKGFLKLHKSLVTDFYGLAIPEFRSRWDVNGVLELKPDTHLNLTLRTNLCTLYAENVPASIALEYDRALTSLEIEHILLEEKHGWVLLEIQERLWSHLSQSRHCFHIQPYKNPSVRFNFRPSRLPPLSPHEEKLIQFQPDTTLNIEEQLAQYLLEMHPQVLGLHHVGMELIYREPAQLPAPAIVFRGWTIQGDSLIASTAGYGIWQPSEGPVWRAFCGKHNSPVQDLREVPAVNCNCGFHAFYTLGRCMEFHGHPIWQSQRGVLSVAEKVIGAIMVTGRLIKYDDGVRAQKARIIAFGYQEDSGTKPYEKLAREYKVPLVPMNRLVEYATEFGMLMEPPLKPQSDYYANDAATMYRATLIDQMMKKRKIHYTGDFSI